MVALGAMGAVMEALKAFACSIHIELCVFTIELDPLTDVLVCIVAGITDFQFDVVESIPCCIFCTELCDANFLPRNTAPVSVQQLSVVLQCPETARLVS
eukprot:7380182-Prymnesium_polylepis.1